MNGYRLRLHLLSDATFGRGDGVAGVVDAEVQHDPTGLPYLAGRTLKGLLGAECADIVFAVKSAKPAQETRWAAAAERLFGKRGGALDGEANLRLGPAQLPDDLRSRVAQDVGAGQITRSEVLESITALRRQTAMDPVTGAPLENTLRAMRVILRETPFEAQLSFQQTPSDDERALLAACVKALRRAGTGRNRGRGKLTADLFDADGNLVTEMYFALFRKAVAA
jgi:CRISPR/Cas system CSM-associated protein Csm3 (group 7 of RAMP superfamily)